MTERSFLGFEFSPVTLEDRNTLTEFLKKNPQRLTGSTIASLAAWRPFFRYAWTFAEPELLLVSCILDPDPHRHLLQPVGVLSSRLVQTLESRAADQKYPLKIIGVSDSFLKANARLTNSFDTQEDRAVSNYLYDAGALAQLPGRKYSKRNLLAQASGLYRWSCEALDSQSIDKCFAVLMRSWRRAPGSRGC
jgi:hypothetical protein